MPVPGHNTLAQAFTVRDAVELASLRIDRRDAETLLAHALQRDRAWLLAHPEAALTGDCYARYRDDVDRRTLHWPVQYLLGRQEFFGLDLQVTPDVLIPRPETELLVEAVLAWARESRAPDNRSPASAREALQIVDVGTGSGAIALALAKHLPQAGLTALDLSAAVRPVVDGNAARLGLSAQIRFLESDLLDVLQEEIRQGMRFDAIVSNPPYVPLADAPTLQPEVRDFEPHLALFAGDDGLAVYQRLIPQAWAALRSGGLLGLEFGFGQRQRLLEMLAVWSDVHFLDDYAGIPRIALAVRP